MRKAFSAAVIIKFVVLLMLANSPLASEHEEIGKDRVSLLLIKTPIGSSPCLFMNIFFIFPFHCLLRGFFRNDILISHCNIMELIIVLRLS